MYFGVAGGSSNTPIAADDAEADSSKISRKNAALIWR